MIDDHLITFARDAEAMANLCRVAMAELATIDTILDIQTDRLLVTHKGDTPQALRTNHEVWRDTIVESLPHFREVVRLCEAQASAWRTDYTRQVEADEAKRRKDAEAH